jgi:stage V sporulation protein SpoVS
VQPYEVRGPAAGAVLRGGARPQQRGRRRESRSSRPRRRCPRRRPRRRCARRSTGTTPRTGTGGSSSGSSSPRSSSGSVAEVLLDADAHGDDQVVAVRKGAVHHALHRARVRSEHLAVSGTSDLFVVKSKI